MKDLNEVSEFLETTIQKLKDLREKMSVDSSIAVSQYLETRLTELSVEGDYPDNISKYSLDCMFENLPDFMALYKENGFWRVKDLTHPPLNLPTFKSNYPADALAEAVIFCKENNVPIK